MKGAYSMQVESALDGGRAPGHKTPKEIFENDHAC
jgi:hypothetical protein